jgi:type IV secretion system protein VirD4
MWIQGDVVDFSISLFYKLFKYIFKGIFFLLTLPFQIYKASKKAKASRAEQTQAISPTIPQPLISFTLHGVMFGTKNRNYIIKPETLDGHILAIGGSGSGKSSCIAIPSLWGWNERVFAIDIKGELYQQTAQYRPNIMRFNPLDERALGYDPFYFLYHTNNPVQEARAIAQAIIPTSPDIKEPFWIESAQTILTGAILYFFSQGASFIEAMQEIQSTPPIELINLIFENGTNEARMHITPFIGMDSKTLYGITTELNRHIVSFATNKALISSFSRKQCITPTHLERGADIYIQIPEYLLEQWPSLLTLIVNQFLNFFERRAEQNIPPILFLLDEFPRLGKIPAILNGLATLRSKKITICLFIQSLAQLDLIYGEHARKVIVDNCAYKAILEAKEAETQEYFSKLVGTYEKLKTTESEQYKAYIPVKQSSSTSTTTEDKRIIRPEEFANLYDIVLLTPFGFCRVDKSPYWQWHSEGSNNQIARSTPTATSIMPQRAAQQASSVYNTGYIPPQTRYSNQHANNNQHRNGYAIASFVLGLCSFIALCLWPLGLTAGILSIVFGCKGINNKKTIKGKAMSIVGIIFGSINTIFILGIFLMC